MSARRGCFETSKLQCASYIVHMGRSQQDDGMSEEIYAGWFFKFECPPECVNAGTAFFLERY